MFEFLQFISEIPKLYGEWVNTISGNNDFLAGTLGVAILGGCSYILRSVPASLYQMIKRKIVLSVIVDSTECGYYELLSELDRYVSSYGSRSFSLAYDFSKNKEYQDSFLCKGGQGFHYFFFNSKPYWYTISDLESTGVNAQKKRIELSTFGLKKKTIQNFIKTLEKPRKSDTLAIWNSEDKDRDFVGYYNSQHIDDICLDKEVRKSLIDILDTYTSNTERSKRLGIPDKLVLIIHGEPGNGKSKLIPGIAKYLKKDINNINVSCIANANDFHKKIRDNDTIHVLEDIHSLSSLSKKKNGVSYVKKKSNELKKPTEQKSSSNIPSISDILDISLSEFLNVLNGSIPLNGQVIIMTTNYIDDLDQAILRPGRTDYVINLPRIKANTVNNWLSERIPEFDKKKGFTKSIRGCDIGGLLQMTYGDAEKIHKQIPLIQKKIPNEQHFNFNDVNNIEF